MRRLILVVVGLAAAGLAVYRRRAIARSDLELAIGPHAASPGTEPAGG